MVSCHRYGHVDMRGPRRGIIYAAVCRAIASQAYREHSNSELPPKSFRNVPVKSNVAGIEVR